VSVWEGPPVEAWSHAWSPWEAAAVLADAGVPWCVVGGWAIELWLGETGALDGLRHREHEDLEIAVLESDFGAVRAALEAHGLGLHPIDDGVLAALVGDESPPPDTHQTWVEDLAAAVWRLDVMREPGTREEWQYRRDPSALRAPRSSMEAVTADGIRYLLPHGVLLFKAKAVRPKDVVDLDACLPLLSPDHRTWLRAAIAQLHPNHDWLPRLE
jgi:hypothetical protein